MPPKKRLSCRVLIEKVEYQRLVNLEKRYKLLQQQQQQKPKSSDLDGEGIDDLEGAGGGLGDLFPGTQSVPSGLPAWVNVNPEPPRPNPCVNTAKIEDRTDRIIQEGKRDKSLHPPANPLNDPLGVRDPDLPPGRAPDKQFVPTKKQRAEAAADEDQGASWWGGGGATRRPRVWRHWHCRGGSNTTTDDDDD